MAIPSETHFSNIKLQLIFGGAGSEDLLLLPSDDADPTAVHYPTGSDPVIRQKFHVAAIHNLTDGDIVYSLDRMGASPIDIAGGNTIKTIPAGAMIQEDPGNSIQRVRITTAGAGNVEVVLYG